MLPCRNKRNLKKKLMAKIWLCSAGALICTILELIIQVTAYHICSNKWMIFSDGIKPVIVHIKTCSINVLGWGHTQVDKKLEDVFSLQIEDI